MGRAATPLAAAPWRAQEAPEAQIATIRAAVGRCLGARFLRGVGLVVLWYGAQKDWEAAAEMLKPDKHGLRATIVQGLVFLDPDTGVSHISQSSWGPISFGDWQDQFSRIRQFCSERSRT